MSQQPEVHAEQEDLTSSIASFVAVHAKKIALIAVAFLVVSGVWISVSKSSRREVEESWTRYARASSASDFANVASDYAGTEVAVWARVSEGRALLNEGLRLQFSDRTAADSQLKKSEEAFDFVVGSRIAPPEAVEQALLGKAFVREATSNGDTAEAITAYESYLARNSDSAYAMAYRDAIKERVESLKKDDTQSFYAWFSKQDPKPEDRQRPTDGLPPGHPEIVTLPEIPAELYPAEWTELKLDAPDAAGSDSPGADPGDTDPAAGTPAGTNATDSPASETPSTQAAPAPGDGETKDTSAAEESPEAAASPADPSQSPAGE